MILGPVMAHRNHALPVHQLCVCVCVCVCVCICVCVCTQAHFFCTLCSVHAHTKVSEVATALSRARHALCWKNTCTRMHAHTCMHRHRRQHAHTWWAVEYATLHPSSYMLCHIIMHHMSHHHTFLVEYATLHLRQEIKQRRCILVCTHIHASVTYFHHHTCYVTSSCIICHIIIPS
jgi:hypothetical protein